MLDRSPIHLSFLKLLNYFPTMLKSEKRMQKEKCKRKGNRRKNKEKQIIREDKENNKLRQVFTLAFANNDQIQSILFFISYNHSLLFI